MKKKTIHLNYILIITLFVYLQKIWYQRVWPFLQHEMLKPDVSAAVLHPVIFLIQESSLEDYETLMLPAMRY